MTRIALLGCGRIGKMHAATIARAEGAVLAAVYDPVAAAAEDIGRRHGCTVAVLRCARWLAATRNLRGSSAGCAGCTGCSKTRMRFPDR